MNKVFLYASILAGSFLVFNSIDSATYNGLTILGLSLIVAPIAFMERHGR